MGASLNQTSTFSLQFQVKIHHCREAETELEAVSHIHSQVPREDGMYVCLFVLSPLQPHWSRISCLETIAGWAFP